MTIWPIWFNGDWFWEVTIDDRPLSSNRRCPICGSVTAEQKAERCRGICKEGTDED